MNPVITRSIFTTSAFWLAFAQAVIGGFAVFQGTYPQAGWIAIVLAVGHALLPTKTDMPVSLTGGTKFR